MTILSHPNRHEREMDVRINEQIAAAGVTLADMTFSDVADAVANAYAALSPEGRQAVERQWKVKQASELIDLELGRRVFLALDEAGLSGRSSWDDVALAIIPTCGFPNRSFVQGAVEAFYADAHERRISPSRSAAEFEVSLREGLPSSLSLIECAQDKVAANADVGVRNRSSVFLTFERRLKESLDAAFPDGIPVWLGYDGGGA